MRKSLKASFLAILFFFSVINLLRVSKLVSKPTKRGFFFLIATELLLAANFYWLGFYYISSVSVGLLLLSADFLSLRPNKVKILFET
jgi:hypothetical protein